jgi:thiamine monophosphate synthase
LDKLEEISRKVRIPVFAIGGINSHRVKAVKKAGAYGVAMISEVFGAEDIEEKTKEIIHTISDDI